MAKQVRPASIYQRADSPVRALAVVGQRRVQRAIKAALRHAGEIVDADLAVARIRAGWLAGVADTVAWGHLGEVFKAVFAEVATVRFAAADLGARRVNARFRGAGRRMRYRKAIGDSFTFDRFDAGTLARIREAQDSLIRELSATARDTINATVMRGVLAGQSPEAIIGEIRAVIGLTSTQAQAVANYRNMLVGLDRGALQRLLRNGALDADIAAAITSGTPLDAAFIEQAVRDYEDNYLDYRAATIAQTESVRASNEGLHDAYAQAVERGALPDAAVRRYWKVSLDERTCSVCLSIPDLNPQGVGVNDAFRCDAGPIDDPPQHPNCRCEVEYVTDLDLVPDEER